MKLRIEHTWDGRPVGGDEAAEVRLSFADRALRIEVDAPFHGDPAPDGQGSTPGLWDYEVVEVFLLGEGERYTEIELGPHGHHLVLMLEGERNAVHQGTLLDYAVERQADRWTGVARVPLGWLPPDCDRLNAYAIHGRGEDRRYLAWRPTLGAAPDFHRLERFGRWPTTP